MKFPEPDDTYRAMVLMNVAERIQDADMLIRDSIRSGGPLRNEKQAVDLFGEAAPTVVRALREMAMRLDRDALGKFMDATSSNK